MISLFLPQITICSEMHRAAATKLHFFSNGGRSKVDRDLSNGRRKRSW